MKSLRERLEGGNDEKKAKERLQKSLFAAAQSGDSDNVRYLIDQGADPNHKEKGDTPLLVAAAHKHPEVVRVLLERGADWKVKNKKGKTATDLAKDNNDQKTVYILSSVLGDKKVFELLESMNLLEHWDKFLKEEVKYQDLVGYTDKDLEEMGIPKGPRGRLLNHLQGNHSAGQIPSIGAERARVSTLGVEPRSASQIARSDPARPTPPSRGGSFPDLPTVRVGSLISNRPLARDQHDRRSLPVVGSNNNYTNVGNNDKAPTGGSVSVDSAYIQTPTFTPEARPAYPGGNTYGVMPKFGSATNNGHVEPQNRNQPPPQLSVDNHYIATPQFEPQLSHDGGVAVGQDNYAVVEDNDDSGNQYAAVGYSGPEYADVVDESEYASEPDVKPESAQTVPAETRMERRGTESGKDFDSSSYREINYAELVLEEEIGRGAFGSVYRGTWRGAPVAIKKLHSFSIADQHMVAEFRREAAMMQLVGNHPNIVKFVGACSKEEPYCLVSLFCSNGSLESFLKKEKLTQVLEAKVLMEIAAGVLHLHCEGVIHRDLAARNVLVGDNYQVYITDFGFARIKEAGNAFNTTQSTIGPVKYMAPESLKDKKYSEKTDAFSFGVLLWEVLNPGKVPYEGEDLLKIAMAVITNNKRLAIPEQAAPVYKKLMQDCWQTEPDKRPNFQEIYRRLSDYYKELSGGSKGALPTSTTPSATPGRGAAVPPRGGLAPRGGRGLPPARPTGGVPKPQPAGAGGAPKPQPAGASGPPKPQPAKPQEGGTYPNFPQQPTNNNPVTATSLTPTTYASYTPPPGPPTYASYTPPPEHTYQPQPTNPPPGPTGYPYNAPTAFPTPTSGYTSYTPQVPTYTAPPPGPPAPAFPYNPSGGYTSYPPQPFTPAPPMHGYVSYDQPSAYLPPPADPYSGGGYVQYGGGYASVPPPTGYPH